MLRQRSSRVDPDRTGDRGRQRAERVGAGSSRHRRYRAGVECLEDRRLLSAITEFPLPTTSGAPGPLTVAPDGNLWFLEADTGDTGGIGRITPSGAVTEFPLPTNTITFPTLTVGPDGNLWFFASDRTGGHPRIDRITPSGTVTEFPLPTTLPPTAI